MSVIEGGTKVATGVVDSLKGQPIILALVIFQIVFLIISYYGLEHSRSTFITIVDHTIDHMVQQQDKVLDKITSCTFANNKGATQ